MENNISIKNALKKTNIEIDSNFLNKIWSKMINETNGKLVPPLFGEFIISVKIHNKIYNDMKACLIEEGIIFPNTDKEKADAHINKAIQNMIGEVRHDFVEIYYVKYLSATRLTLIYFDGIQYKKRINVELEYKCENSAYDIKIVSFSENYFKDNFDKSLSTEENTEKIVNDMFYLVRVVSHYMLTYNPDVEYKEATASKLKRSTDKSGNYKKNHNKGYSQTIKLISKKTKYTINDETNKRNQQILKKYHYHKKSWFVRGYYQRFGKDKVIKFVPPRINYRNDDKISPSPAKYIIKE